MLILLIALPLLTGLAAALPFPSRRGRLTFLLTMQIIETALVVWTLVSGRSYATNIWHLTESLTIAMKLDGVAAVFSALTAVAWLLALIYSVEYMSHSQNEARFYVFLFLSEGMLLGTALSADFVSMYVFYELTSLCSMPLVLHELTHLPVIVDPSHATGVARYVKPMAMAAAACGADGLIIEVHNDPPRALCDGAQSLRPEQFEDVVKAVYAIRTAAQEV